MMAKPKKAITVHRVASESAQAAKEACIPRGNAHPVIERKNTFDRRWFLLVACISLICSPEVCAKSLARDVWGATPVPDRIILTWNADPGTTQAVTWRTNEQVGSPLGQVAVATGVPTTIPRNVSGVVPGFEDDAITVKGETTVLDADLGRALYHSLVFTDLAPETLYAYRVGDGERWSEWFHFRTASRSPAQTTFIYLGDAQNSIKSYWSRVIRQAYTHARGADFIIHAGDLVNHANSDQEWGEWTYAAGWLNGMLPSIPTPGNHEYTRGKIVEKTSLSKHWRPQFELPTNGPSGLEETTYFLDYQGIRIVSLNSNEKVEEQAEWLDGVLADNPHQWTVLTFHHPVFSAARGRDNVKLRELWLPVIDRHQVDLVLQGHDHTYGRTGNVSRGLAVLDNEKGTIYVVSVSGPKMYRSHEHPLMRRLAEDTQLYQVIEVDGNQLTYRAYTAVGVLYDAFDLLKQTNSTNRLVELSPEMEERRRGPK